MKLANFTKEMLRKFFEPKSAYEEALLKRCQEEGYEKDYKRGKLINEHTWDRGAIHGSKMIYTCVYCGITAEGGRTGGPEYFCEWDGDLCLSEEEKVVKDIIE